jgi:hypothetical protein
MGISVFLAFTFTILCVIGAEGFEYRLVRART